MPDDIASTERQIDPPPTVVGATGLSPSDNHPTSLYVVIEVDGKQGRTAEIAPSPQSAIEWNARFPLRAGRASYIALRLYKCWKSMPSGHLRGDKAIWESGATAEQLLRCGSNFTNMTLPAKAPYEGGHLIVKGERAAHTGGECPVVGESSAKPRWQGEKERLKHSAVRSVHDIADTIYSDVKESHLREKLDDAIDHHRASLRLRPPGHPDRSSSPNNLASTFSTRFEQRGDTADLDEAIELNRAALTLHPQGHPDRSMSLNNLAVTPSTRFKLFGDRADLDEAAALSHDLYVTSHTPPLSGWFKSVIGTMWAVDETPHHVVSVFFKMVFDYTKAPASLDLGCVHGGQASCPPRAEDRVRSRWGLILSDTRGCVRY